MTGPRAAGQLQVQVPLVRNPDPRAYSTRRPSRRHTGSPRLRLGPFSPSRRFWNALAAVTGAAAGGGCDCIYQARPRRARGGGGGGYENLRQKRQPQTCQWTIVAR